MIRGRRRTQTSKVNKGHTKCCLYKLCSIHLFFACVYGFSFILCQDISIPGRNGYYGPTSPTRPPYIIGAQMNPQYNLNTQHVGHLGNFGQGLEEVKHSIRQDEAFGGQRHNNGNSRPIRYSESRQYDLQNERKSDKDYVLVSKTAQNGYKPEEIVINQMEIDDLPAGDYEIVAMFDDEKQGKDQNSYRRPRLASYRHPSDATNSFRKGHNANKENYLRPPGSTFNHGYPQQTAQPKYPPQTGYRGSAYEDQYQHSNQQNNQRNYHHQQIYHPQQQNNPSLQHNRYNEHLNQPVVHSLPSIRAGSYKQSSKNRNNHYVPQYEAEVPKQYTNYNTKPKAQKTRNLTRQQLLKQRLKKIIKPYNDYDYEYNYNDSGASNDDEDDQEYNDEYKNDYEPYITTSPPIPSPTPNYQSKNSGNKRHINRYVNSGHHQEVQNIRTPNPSYPRNGNPYYVNEQPQLSYNNQHGQSRPSVATASSLFVTPLPPSSSTTPQRPTKTNKSRAKNKYNNRYKENVRTDNTGRKGNNRNLRRFQQKQYPDKRQHLDKLFEIAGQNPKNQQLDTLLEIAGGRPNRQTSRGSNNHRDDSSFKCPQDGHYGDKADCTKYYHCAHGVALTGFCPNGLFWNQASDQCDWPESVDCDFDPSTVRKLKQRTYLYLTFDDGPNEGTPNVLRALQTAGVPATFFINSDNLENDPKRAGQAERNAHSLLTTIQAGHILADHSYDHMSHNSHDSPRNAYQDVNNDLRYFGDANINPVLDLMWSARATENDLAAVNDTMSKLVRMPYTNAWRLGRLHHDCFPCTVPASSGSKGIEISNRLEGAGKSIIGWDVEWPVNWNTNRLKTAGATMYGTMNSRHTKTPGKIVLLMHDVAYRDGVGFNSETSADQELLTFITLAKESGYVFSTLDRYLQDQ